MSPWRPASMMTMKPTTTPGKASGKVSIAISRLRPRNVLRSRNTPAMVATASVSSVTPAASRSVESRLRKYRGSLTMAP